MTKRFAFLAVAAAFSLSACAERTDTSSQIIKVDDGFYTVTRNVTQNGVTGQTLSQERAVIIAGTPHDCSDSSCPDVVRKAMADHQPQSLMSWPTPEEEIAPDTTTAFAADPTSHVIKVDDGYYTVTRDVIPHGVTTGALTKIDRSVMIHGTTHDCSANSCPDVVRQVMEDYDPERVMMWPPPADAVY